MIRSHVAPGSAFGVLFLRCGPCGLGPARARRAGPSPAEQPSQEELQGPVQWEGASDVQDRRASPRVCSGTGRSTFCRGGLVTWHVALVRHFCTFEPTMPFLPLRQALAECLLLWGCVVGTQSPACFSVECRCGGQKPGSLRVNMMLLVFTNTIQDPSDRPVHAPLRAFKVFAKFSGPVGGGGVSLSM